MIYTTTIANTGNVRVGGTKVSHLLAQNSAMVCDKGFEAATSLDVRARFPPLFLVAAADVVVVSAVAIVVVDVNVDVDTVAHPTPAFGRCLW